MVVGAVLYLICLLFFSSDSTEEFDLGMIVFARQQYVVRPVESRLNVHFK